MNELIPVMNGKDGQKPYVTVIIPAYNAGKWLDATLESLKNQTFDNWRAIIANDGSTDSTSEISKRFAAVDPRFAVLSLPHKGVSATRNAALDIAATDRIMFLDADDILHPQALEVLAAAADGGDSDIIIAGMSYGEIPSAFPDLSFAHHDTIGSTEAVRRLLLRKDIEASMCGILYRRTLFQQPCPLRFREGMRYEDLDLGYRIMERAKNVTLLFGTLYYYRANPESFINRFSEERLDTLDVTDRMYEHFKGSELEKAAADRRFGAHYSTLLISCRYKLADKGLRGRCMKVVKSCRRSSLFGKGIRLKNRLGALASYGGLPAICLLAKILRPK